jgi:class 3 adenylate cyclase
VRSRILSLSATFSARLLDASAKLQVRRLTTLSAGWKRSVVAARIVATGPSRQENSGHPACSTREFFVTETEPHARTRTLVASFLFTDLVGFSIGSAAEQTAAKATLSSIIRSDIAALRPTDYRIRDTGDGALIAFVTDPEHALYMALAIAQDFGRAAAAAGFPSNSLRTGLHLGAVKEVIDVEARPNFIGDGINAAKRIMDFAAPGQITASRAFFEAVAGLDSAFGALFKHVGAPDDKHGRAHELYTAPLCWSGSSRSWQRARATPPKLPPRVRGRPGRGCGRRPRSPQTARSDPIVRAKSRANGCSLPSSWERLALRPFLR